MITNNTNLGLPLQLFMVHSDYDHINEPKYISATSLLSPVRATVLKSRIKSVDLDLLDLQAAAIGTASHDRLEKAFSNGNYILNMKKLGYPQNVIDSIVINPVEVKDGQTPIYLEKRSIMPLNGFKIGGKFDFVGEGIVRDLKTTKIFKWLKGDFDDYIKQGSIYRWLNQDIITEDYMYIDFMFTDWKAFEAQANPKYPQASAISKKLPLMSIEDTKQFIIGKTNQINQQMALPDAELIRCADSELWMDAPKFAYYKNPTAKRSTKNYDNSAEAHARLMNDGGVGRVEERKSEPKRCNWCVKDHCSQAQQYILDGILKQ